MAKERMRCYDCGKKRLCRRDEETKEYLCTECMAVLDAARMYIARRSRALHPDGGFDDAGRWYPSESERRWCCGAIRNPSRQYPYSYMVHCRTMKHVALLHDASEKRVRERVWRLSPPKERG